MANKNIKVYINRPGFGTHYKVPFDETYGMADTILIPRRLPYTDIKNLAQLKLDGFFRTNTKVTSSYGGSNLANGVSTLGLKLPRTEKLILLAKLTDSSAVNLTITGNKRAGVEDRVVAIGAGAANDVIEIDLYDFGFFVTNGAGDGITIKTDHDVKLTLIARY